MTYTDPIRLLFKGDVEKAKRYVREARRFAFDLVRRAADSGVQSLRSRHPLNDGTIIDVVVAGWQVTATITVPLKKKLARSLDDFVVWARNNTLPDGIDGDNSEQILRPFVDNTWQAYTFDAEVANGRSDGTYSGRLPDGLRYNGNCDWRSADDERLSWYGPSLRYWCDRWRQPSATYGRWVFMLGSVLLDIDQYCIDAEVDIAERLVLGAAINGSHLLVMQASMADMPDPPTAPIGRGLDVYVTAPYTTSIVNLRLVRYQLTVVPNAAGVRFYNVVTGSHETLWTNSAFATVNPWVFNPDGTRCETVVMPASPHVHRYSDTAGVYFYNLADETHQHVRLDIAEDNTVSLEVTNHGLTLYDTSGEPQECLIATDFDVEGNQLQLMFGYEAYAEPIDYLAGVPGSPYADPREDYRFVVPWARYFFRMGEHKIYVFEPTELTTMGGAWSRPMVFDIREAAAVFGRYARVPPDPFDIVVDLLAYNRGVLNASKELERFHQDNINPPFHTFWQSLTTEGGNTQVTPLAMLFGAGMTGTAANPFHTPSPWDPWARYIDIGFNPPWAFQDTEQLFGVVVFYDETGTVAASFITFASQVPPDMPYSRYPDALGRKNAMALATSEGVLLFSGPGHKIGDGAVNVHLVTANSLPAITGIADQNARFHPLWLLGKPAKETV